MAEHDGLICFMWTEVVTNTLPFSTASAHDSMATHDLSGACCQDIGGMERSVYFGRRKDLYHFDHFMGHFQNVYPELLTADSYSIDAAEQEAEDCQSVTVQVSSGETRSTFRFLLVKKTIGKKKGSLMTRTLTRL